MEYRIFESALYRTTSTLMRWETGLLVVDPCWLPAEVADIRDAAAAWQGERQLWLFFTHADYDHILGAGAFPAARVLASEVFAQHIDREQALAAVLDWDDQHYIQRPYPLYFPEPNLAPSQPGQPINLAGRLFLSWPAPGHTPDGMLLLDPESGILLVGDYLSNVEFPFVHHSLTAYHHTLDRLQEIVSVYQPRLLVPGHGDPATSPQEMQNRITQSRAYLHDLTSANPPPETHWPNQFPYSRSLLLEHRANLARVKEGRVG